MKVELIGDIYTKKDFITKPGVYWSLWLNKDYVIASGHSAGVAAAERAGNEAFEKFKRALAHRKKPIRFQELA